MNTNTIFYGNRNFHIFVIDPIVQNILVIIQSLDQPTITMALHIFMILDSLLNSTLINFKSLYYIFYYGSNSRKNQRFIFEYNRLSYHLRKSKTHVYINNYTRLSRDL